MPGHTAAASYEYAYRQLRVLKRNPRAHADEPNSKLEGTSTAGRYTSLLASWDPVNCQTPSRLHEGSRHLLLDYLDIR